MLMKRKKKSLKLKKSKISKIGKNRLEITFPRDFALILLTVSEKTRFTDDGCPRHGTSSADTVKQS